MNKSKIAELVKGILSIILLLAFAAMWCVVPVLYPKSEWICLIVSVLVYVIEVGLCK